MASCDIFSCVRHIFTSDEEYAKKAEENAENLSAVYASHVIESQCALEETIRTARTHIKALQAAKAQNNAPAVARATANTRASAARVRELRVRTCHTSEELYFCERIPPH